MILVKKDKVDMFNIVYKLLKLVLVLPVATAGVEMIFSTMNYIKNKLRYNPSFSAGFFNRNSVFLSQQISRNSVSACFLNEANGAKVVLLPTAHLSHGLSLSYNKGPL